jgi:hypothetical protein
MCSAEKLQVASILARSNMAWVSYLVLCNHDPFPLPNSAPQPSPTLPNTRPVPPFLFLPPSPSPFLGFPFCTLPHSPLPSPLYLPPLPPSPISPAISNLSIDNYAPVLHYILRKCTSSPLHIAQIITYCT